MYWNEEEEKEEAEVAAIKTQARSASNVKKRIKKIDESSICAATANLIRGLMTFVKYYT